ncbi:MULTISPECIES: hypothetical protein [unclassified Clostridium]|uniref:anti-sigma-I factor RsgI family protein n=1 Tax=unclassified Clostridium TaxID=2614128 RepID=UPI00029802A6|nr:MULTISPECIES: hypothetical protein [unclassified Clostridium]EKQ53290.1 MAG: hypothetical protein A370_03807 [Clostridium sp. Maddingley MBC34-26]
MKDELFEKLEDLDISSTDFLLNEEINLLLNSSTRKRIEESVMKKTGYYKSANTITLSDKINNILGGILMKRKIALALSTVVALGLGGGGYAYAKTTPVAYVSLDINPSVELGVNTFDQVISVEAYNEDGQKVLEGTNLVNSNVNEAVKIVISNAVSDGYVKEDDTLADNTASTTATTSAAVEITVSTDKEKVAIKLEESLKEVADKTLENNELEAAVETDKVALARRDEARQLGITPGKLNLIQKLQALDPTIKVEDYKSSSVKDIQKKAKELRKMKNDSDTNTGENTTTNTNTDTNTSNDTNTSAGSNTTTVTNTGASGDDIQKDEKVLQLSSDSEKDDNSDKDKVNNGRIKKEENAERKEERISDSDEKEKNNGADNGNSSKSEKSNNGNSKGNNQGKGKNK